MADSGCSTTVITEKMAARMKLNRKNVHKVLELADGKEIETTAEARVKVFEILTPKGAIVIRNVPVLIIAGCGETKIGGNDDEVLIGDDVLLCLGIDINALLLERANLDFDYDTTRIRQFPELGGNDPVELIDILEEKLKNVPQDHRERWRKLILDEHLDEFRVELGMDPPAALAPMEVRWQPEQTPPIRPVRISYSIDQKEHMKIMVEKLLRNGLIRKNPRARFVSECLVVKKVPQPKDVAKDFRMVINLKRANNVVQPIYIPLPTLEEVQLHLKGAKYFVVMDLTSGYWQISLHENSQELFSFCTDEGTYTPNRIPQGATDAVMYFSHLMRELFSERLYSGIIVWLDDILLYADSLEELFDLLRFVLAKARGVGLKFSAAKLSLLEERMRWCGKVLTEKGIEVDPRKLEAIRRMPMPRTAGELFQFIYAANWIRTAVPGFAEDIAPLHNWLNAILKGGKRTKRRAQAIELKWTRELKAQFENIRFKLLNAVTLAHPDPNATLLLFPDASNLFWGALLAQVHDFDLNVDVGELNLEPLYFLSGAFKGNQLGWSTCDKEAYAVVESARRLRHVICGQKGFRLYTDHKNLVFLYGKSDSGKIAGRGRLERWALEMQQYRFDIEHIEGEKNVWADLLSRWGASGNDHVVKLAAKASKVRKRPRLRATPRIITPLLKLEWPDLSKIRLAQQADSDCRPDIEGKIYIPPSMRAPVIVVAHYGSNGHNMVATTIMRLKKFCYWDSMEEDVKNEIAQCVLCRTSKGTRPNVHHFGESRKPTRPNQIIHFDYYSVGCESRNGFKYLMVIRDGFSRFTLLSPTKTPDAASAVESLLHWIGLFGRPAEFRSDNGSHFRHEVMKDLCQRLNITHTFSTAYCAWSNGLIERVNRDINCLIKIMLRENRIDEGDWPELRDLLMYGLNQRPSKLLGAAPVEIHTLLKPTDNLDLVFDGNRSELADFEWTVGIEKRFEELQVTLDTLHDTVRCNVHQRTQKQKEKEATMGLEKFELGDYVLYCLVDRHTRPKMLCTWVGPFQVVDWKSKYVYRVRNLVNSEVIDAHVTRLEFYSTESMNETQELKEDIMSQQVYQIETLEEIIYDEHQKEYVVKVKWQGFSEVEATFEPFRTLLPQIPRWLLGFLENLKSEQPKKFENIWKKEKRLISKIASKAGYEWRH